MNIEFNNIIRSLPPELNIVKIVVHYSGSGDSGEIDYIEFIYDQGKTKIVDNKINDKIGDFVYDLLQVHHPGWEINDGAAGTYTFDLIKNQVTNDYDEYYREAHASQTVKNFNEL